MKEQIMSLKDAMHSREKMTRRNAAKDKKPNSLNVVIVPHSLKTFVKYKLRKRRRTEKIRTW